MWIEYRYFCYFKKSPTACENLSTMFINDSKFNPKSEEKAQKILEKNCLENSWANSCYGAGQRILGISENADDETRLEADKQDKWIKSSEYFKKGCDLGNAESCNMAGVFYSLETEKWRNWGRGYERDDREQALLDEKMSDKYLSKSCELGSVVGCYNYANFKKMSDETVDINAENKAYEKACALNHIQSCLCLAANYENGRGFDRDEKKSNELVKKAQSLARLEQMRQLYAER